MDEQNMTTPIDIMTQTKELQILKTLVPFMPQEMQKNLIMLVQCMQFQKTMEIFDNPPAELSAASISNETGKTTAMLSAIRKFCSPREQETIDNILNILNLMDGRENYGDI